MINRKIPAAIVTIITIIYSFIIAGMDVSEINHNSLPFNEHCYEVSTYIGYSVFVVIAIFAMIGLVQLIKRKSLLKVDKRILGMGVLFIVTLAIYVIFNKVVINYRPVIVPGEGGLEPSFPSSHTIMVIVVAGSAIMVIDDYIKSKGLQAIAKAVLAFMVAGMISYRVFSGVHWMTDIVAGILFSFSLLLWYDAFTNEKAGFTLVDKEVYDNYQQRKKEEEEKKQYDADKRGGKHFKKLTRDDK